jgi:uncharacterized protein YxeA
MEGMMKYMMMGLTMVMMVTFSASAFASDKDEKKKGDKGKFSAMVKADKDEKKKGEKGK